MLQYDRVRENSDAIRDVSTALAELFATIDKVLKFNTTQAITTAWTRYSFGHD